MRRLVVERLARLLNRVRQQTSHVVPRPPRRGRRPSLRVSLALTASDLTPGYLDFWPLARRAWCDLIGVDALLVVVAARAEAPAELLADPSVTFFEPIEGLHSAFQAQCIRLLYPALLSDQRGVITTDVDMLPLNPDYFHRPPARVLSADFVAYRDVLLPFGQVPICYNAAAPATWSELFDVRSLDDIRTRLASWGHGVAYAGTRGGAGWDTDQETLHEKLLAWGAETRRVWILQDRATGFRRLERAELRKPGRLDAIQARHLRRNRYTDYHALPQSAAYEALNAEILALAGGG